MGTEDTSHASAGPRADETPAEEENSGLLTYSAWVTWSGIPDGRPSENPEEFWSELSAACSGRRYSEQGYAHPRPATFTWHDDQLGAQQPWRPARADLGRACFLTDKFTLPVGRRAARSRALELQPARSG